MKFFNTLLLCIGLLSLRVAALQAQAPCTTNNGIGCQCPNPSDTNCVLLPDITISWDALENYAGGPNEYSQTGNGVNNGRLRVTGATPNIGFGPFTVRGTDYFICGTDTIYDPTRSITTCPDGSLPTNLLKQRIYSKNGANITYTDIWAGGQTYHPGHGHNHVDDWVIFTLRREDPSEPDTLQWPIIGEGAKIGFCLMDFSNCNASNGYCRDYQSYGQGNILTSTDFPNYGMGGGSYSCNPTEQGISVGYLDIYSENLDGMWIDIPPGTCNGDYWIVVQVDPRNNFRESNENNNWTAIPFTLTQQVAQGNAVANITSSGDTYLCGASSLDLEANPADSYLWSTGDTTPTITVTDTGYYYVDIMSQCGSARSDSIHIDRVNTAVTSVIGDTICPQTSTVLQATGTGIINWYDQATGGQPLDTGNTYNTGNLPPGQLTYYVSSEARVPSSPQQVGATPPANLTTSYSGSNYNGYVTFDVLDDIVLRSVWVYTDFPGTRIIELRDQFGTVLHDLSVMIDSGGSTINLQFPIAAGSNYQLGTNAAQNQSIFGDVSPMLVRSSSGVNYPYEIANTIALTGSPFGSTYYYYFYNWEINTPGFTCESPRVPVEVLVNPETNISLTTLDSTYVLQDTNVVLDLTPAGGTLSGPGTSSNGSSYSFNPNDAGLGADHELTYSYTDNEGCQYSETYYVTVKAAPVDTSVGLIEVPQQNELQIYPNPASSTVNIPLHELEGQADRIIFIDITGREVLLINATRIKKPVATIDLTQFNKGLYMVVVDVSGRKYMNKLIVE